MTEILYFSLTNFLLYVLYTVFGMTLLPGSLRREEKKAFGFLLAPLLGAAVWIMLGTSWLFFREPWNLPLRLLIAAVWCGFRSGTLFLPKEKTPYLVLAVLFPVSVGMSRLVYPFEIDGGLYFSFAVYDHVRCAIVGSIANFGIPPVSPWLADNGLPVPLFYYFGWYAWAAQLLMMTKASPLFAESAMTGFSALAALSGLTGVAGLCGLGRKKYGIAAFFFCLLLTVGSAESLRKILPEKFFQALDPASGFVGFWSNIDNFIWSPHHMFSGAVVVLVIFCYFQMLGAKTKREKLFLAVLTGISGASASFTSVYAGTFTLIHVGIAALILCAAWGAFRRRVVRNILPHLLVIAVFLLLSVFYFHYLTAVRSETSPLAFGMMPAFREWTGPFRWIRYLFSLYFFQLPNNLGLYYLFGLIACLVPGLLPETGLMRFLRIFTFVSLLSITFIHSSFYSNDFGWRTFTAASYLLSLFSAFLFVKFIGWFCSGARGRKIFGSAVVVLLIVFECFLYKDSLSGIGLRTTYPELRGQFARSVRGWDVVHQYTKKSDLVQCNPRSFYELGMLYEIKEYSTNIFFSLYSQRATAVGDMIFSKCYSEYYPQQKLQQRYDRVCRIFSGDPPAREIAYLAEELKIKAVLVTPCDGIWKKPGAIRRYYPRVVQTADYRIYLTENAAAGRSSRDQSR